MNTHTDTHSLCNCSSGEAIECSVARKSGMSLLKLKGKLLKMRNRASPAFLILIAQKWNEFTEQIDDDLPTLIPLRLKDSSAVLPGDC